MLGAVLVLGIIAATVGVMVGASKTYSRGPRLAEVAHGLGLRVSAPEPSFIEQMPFALLHRGTSRMAENIMWGTRNGTPVKVFDYAYSIDREHHEFVRYTCAVMAIAANCPRFDLTPENAVARLNEHLGGQDVELEYDAFNRRFRVNADQKFAFTLLDGRMMEWLLGAPPFEHLEVCGGWVLVVRSQEHPKTWPELVALLDGFRAHLPPLVLSTSPPA